MKKYIGYIKIINLDSKKDLCFFDGNYFVYAENKIIGTFFENEFHNLFVVTSRNSKAEFATHHWINTNFYGVFQDIIMTKAYGKDKIIGKSKFCKNANISILIDDSYFYAQAAKDNGIIAFLRNCPWNKSESYVLIIIINLLIY